MSQRGNAMLVLPVAALVAGFAANYVVVWRIARDPPALTEQGLPQWSTTNGASWYYRVRRAATVVRVDAKAVNARVTAGQHGESDVSLPRWSRFSLPPTKDEVGLERTEIAIGWPWPSLAGLAEWPAASRRRSTRPTILEGRDLALGTAGAPRALMRRNALAIMPTRPLWRGLILNTVVFALLIWPCLVVAWLLFLKGPLSPVRLWRRRSGRCPDCAYDLRGELDHGCPECGWHRKTGTVTTRSNAPRP